MPRARNGIVVVTLGCALALAGVLGGACRPGTRLPAGERGRVVQLELPSPSLPVPARLAEVYLPASYARETTRRYPVLYFLHGGPGALQDWFSHGALAESLDVLIASHRSPELIAIAPDGHGPGARGRSLWTNSFDGRWPLDDYLVHDVVRWADSTLRTRADARHRGLVGISDGGDAAVALLLRHPDVFGGCAGFSGRYHPHDAAGYEAIAGPPPGRDSVLRACAALALPDSVLARVRGANVYFDAGVLDLTARDCFALDRRFRRLGVPHEAHLYIGWHNWPFWRERYAVALGWITRGW